MSRVRVTRASWAQLVLLAASAAAAAAAAAPDANDITDEEFYSMPQLFHLDQYEACTASGQLYCVGSFSLSSDGPHRLLELMQRYSSDWVDRYNHTRLHRGMCLHRACPHLHPASVTHEANVDWFVRCVNESTFGAYNLSAELHQLEYCAAGRRAERALSANERAFAAFVAALLALAAVSTALDLTLPDHARKSAEWALAWSLPGCWRALTAPPPPSSDTHLNVFDGLRMLCMMIVIVEHVCWLGTLTYVADPRYSEVNRREFDVMLLTNSTLVVQIFFMMSSFLLAHKLLQQQRRGAVGRPARVFAETMVNRIIRISPAYWTVVWLASSWWSRLGRGPLWAPLVGAEAAVCRRKWWTHLLYLNNVLYPDDKCLIQTWYLAADMQLYAGSLALTLALQRCRSRALPVLGALLALCCALLLGLAYWWSLIPTFIMHRPECVRQSYSGEASFNVLYQSPLGNVCGALAGLLLAHVHHALVDRAAQPATRRWFRWSCWWGAPLALAWVACSPRLLGAGAPARLPAAALAALERPAFAVFVFAAIIGALHGVDSPLCAVMAWRGWAVPARLSFGALLLHMPLNKAIVALAQQPRQLDHSTAVVEWFGVAAASYLAAVPLALLVELPAARLQRALTRLLAARKSRAVAPAPHDDKASER